MARVEFKKLYEDSILPTKAHETDAGFDLYAHSFHEVIRGVLRPLDVTNFRLEPGNRVLVKAGFGMAIPPGYEAQVRPRSGLALKNGISVVNSPGTIDAGYRNEVGVILINMGHVTFELSVGGRIAQLVVNKLPEIEVVEVDELSVPSERGAAGFGSTGV